MKERREDQCARAHVAVHGLQKVGCNQLEQLHPNGRVVLVHGRNVAQPALHFAEVEGADNGTAGDRGDDPTSFMMPNSSRRRITPRWKMLARNPPPERASPILGFLGGVGSGVIGSYLAT